MSEVTSVNGKTGAVVLTPADVEAVPTAVEGQPNGVATLDSSGVLHEAQLPSQVARSSAATISPLTHGAKWDGVTDDSAALQASINESVEREGVPIVLPPGIGVINSEPEIPKNLAFRITIRGVDRDATTVKLTSAMRFLTYVATEPGDTIGNVNLSDFTVDGNNQLTVVAHGTSVIIGQKFTSASQVNIRNIDIHRIRTKNVPALAKKEGGRRNLEIYCYHSEPGLPLNVIENIKISQLILEQGQSGVTLLAQGPTTPLPLNIRFRNILIEDIYHTITAAPSETGYSSNVQIGQNGWTDQPETVVIQRIWGKNSADVGVEADCACVLRDIETIDANNCGVLLNTFNPSVSEPIVSKITELAAAGSTTIAVSASAPFKIGRQIAIYGTGVATSEIRTVKGKLDGTHLELSEATGLEWVAGTFISQVDNQEGVRWTCRKIRNVRTVTLPGLGRGLVIQNSENVLPCPDVDVDGMVYNCTASDIGSGGEALQVQTGTANSPTGNPALIKIRGFKLNRENLENATSGTKNFNPMNFIMRGPGARVDLVGEVIVTGAGNTGAGKLPGQILRFVRSTVDIDIELTTKWTLGSTGGERWCGISLSEGEAGDIGGRLRHVARTSMIESGGGAQVGIRMGHACAFASRSIKTKLTKAIAVKGVALEVESTQGFVVGDDVVIDALSTTKSEIFTIAGVNEAEKKLTLVSAGNTPGVTEEHAVGATIALLNTIVVRDSRWRGLGTTGTDIGFEDNTVSVMLRQRGNVLPIPPTSPPKQVLPESAKSFRMSSIQKGQMGIFELTGGTVTSIEHSPNGVNFAKIGSATPSTLHVSPTDYLKITWTVEPVGIFVADRN